MGPTRGAPAAISASASARASSTIRGLREGARGDDQGLAVGAFEDRTWIAEARRLDRALEQHARAGPAPLGHAPVDRLPRRGRQIAAPVHVHHQAPACADAYQHVAFAARALEHLGHLDEGRREDRIQHRAGVDRRDGVRAGGAVADAHLASLAPHEQARAGAVAERRGRRVHADLGRLGADRMGHGAAHDGRVRGLLRRGREVHPVASAARGDVRADGRHAIRSGRDHLHDPAAGRACAPVDLGLDLLAGRRAGDEDGAALDMADPRAARSEALDLQARNRASRRLPPALSARLVFLGSTRSVRHPHADHGTPEVRAHRRRAGLGRALLPSRITSSRRAAR
jgi:hypothetical protein